jgi:hypothetical protein
MRQARPSGVLRLALVQAHLVVQVLVRLPLLLIELVLVLMLVLTPFPAVISL